MKKRRSSQGFSMAVGGPRGGRFSIGRTMLSAKMLNEQQERLEELLKLAYDVDDSLSHPVDGLDDSTPLWKLYLRNRIALSVRMKVDVAGQPTSHYFFPEFEALPTRVERHRGVVDGSERRVALEATSDIYEYGVDNAVFVCVGEVLESDEGIFTPVPSVVRLKQLNHCPMPRGYLPQATGLGKISALDSGDAFIPNRELDFLNVPRRLAPGVVESKLPNEVVEGRSQVVNDVPDYEPRSAQKRVGHLCDVEDVLACVRVDLGANSYQVSFSLDDRFDFALQGIVVLDCPVDLGSDAAEVGLVGHG